MRVLQVINSLELAGAEVLVADLVPRLRRRGALVSVALLNRVDTRLVRSLQDVPDCVIYGERRPVRSPSHAIWLSRLFRQFDVVHSHLTDAQYWVALAASIAGTQAKLITTEHNPDNNRRGKSLWRWPDRWMYGRYDSIVCNSQATADVLTSWVPRVGDRTVVIPNGIVFQRFAPSAHPSQNQRPPVGISVARLEPQKDHLTLLKALARVPAITLQLVGDGTLRPELERFVAASNLGDRVQFLGWRDDVPALLQRADFCVHSTHSDGFGIAVVEAMAAGLPVIASAVPGLSWVVGDAGILCRPGDEADLAAQMSRLASDPSLRAELSAKGKARAAQFDIEYTADAHLRLYESLIGAAKPAELTVSG